MTATVNSGKRRNLFVLIVSTIVVILLVALAAVALTNINRQQDRESLAQIKKEQLTTLLDAKEKLPAAIDKYFAAFKKSYVVDYSLEKAEQEAKPEREAFDKAESSARSAMAKLKSSRGADSDDVRGAVAQFEDSYLGFVDYAAGLVDSYALYTSLWGTDESLCQGIFIGDRDVNLTERDELLGEAVDECRGATKKLAKSKNTSYAEYAQRIDNRVVQLKTDSAVTAEAEQKLATFTAQYKQFEKQYDRAIATNASEKKLLALAYEISRINNKISANKADFDFASKRYLATVEEKPPLLGDVFEKHVPAEIKYYDSVIEMRADVLEKVLADAVVE